MNIQSCPPIGTGNLFLSGVLRHLDCQAGTIGSAGYAALSNPGSPVSLALTAVLTIFIAIFGLRMVLGATPTFRESVMAVVKIGVVLLIATSWSAYRTVVYDVVVLGPGQLGATIGGATGLEGDAQSLIDRLQTADQAMSRVATLGSGRNDLVSRPAASPDGVAVTTEREPVADDPAFGLARTVFLASTVAALGGVRLMAGILLALAPLFAGLLLFDMARGLFIGWVRALVFTVLASVAVTIVLGTELALIEPWLSNILQLRTARVITASAPIEMLVLTIAFSLSLAGSAALMLRLAFMIHLPSSSTALDFPNGESQASLTQTPPAILPAQAPAGAGASRAVGVAEALSSAQRRESAFLVARSASGLGGKPPASASLSADAFAIPSPGPVARRTRPRRSVGGGLRDART